MSKQPPKPLTLLQQLSADKFAADCIKYPITPKEYIPKKIFSDRKANGLTQCILTRLHLDGWQAERINRIGRPIDNRKQVQDVLGRTRIIGSVQFVRSGGTDGTADISATIRGRSVKVEIKINRDTQSDEQKAYQLSVEAAGGLYLIATGYENFLEQYRAITQ